MQIRADYCSQPGPSLRPFDRRTTRHSDRVSGGFSAIHPGDHVRKVEQSAAQRLGICGDLMLGVGAGAAHRLYKYPLILGMKLANIKVSLDNLSIRCTQPRTKSEVLLVFRSRQQG